MDEAPTGRPPRLIVGISDKMLAQTLRTLEHDGLIDRAVTATVPPRVDYALTATGTELVERLLPLVEWVADNADAIVGRS